jgi:dipeptidyl aminopeptidase/acylaminoacyl peptidase
MSGRVLICAVMTALMAGTAMAESRQRVTIPDVPAGTQRFITAGDLAHLRRLETLSLSPDGSRFAILVRQGDPVANEYRRGWFIGSSQTGVLTFVGDGGDARLARELPGGRSVGALERPLVRWSPDGRSIAYTRLSDGAVQLWRSDLNGRSQPITHNAADVRQFEWSEDSRSIYFTVGATRAEQLEREVARERAGYRYDEDLRFFPDLWLPQMQIPQPTPATTVWIVTAKGIAERLANNAERAEYERIKGRADPTASAGVAGAVRSQSVVQTVNAKGARAWLTRSKDDTSSLRVNVSLSGSDADAIECAAEECSGLIQKIWWLDDTVLIWRREGMRASASGIYAWTPASGTVTAILRTSDDFLKQCDLSGRRLVCMRESSILPDQVVGIDIPAGGLQVLADVNPEFRNIRLGKVERFEWDTPKFAWGEAGQPLHGVYAERAYGYIYYPPDFDSTKKYPVYINPYSAEGFENSTVQETPSHVMAAQGMVVLSTSFPRAAPNVFTPAKDLQKLGYSPELDFPHVTMFGESTLRALDTVVARGFIDERRVGIGGVSNGAFVPLFMVQKHDRFAAVSVGSTVWSSLGYYFSTRQSRPGTDSWMVKPEGDGMKLWRGIDLAENVETIEAPIMMNLSESELVGMVRLIRHMDDAGKPYDAYVFRDETHMKWQPAHLHAIVQRNLDWFNFWLQGREDADPAKAEQYERWRKLKQQHEADRAKRAAGQ